ncbi:MAG: hypothetical protein JWM27_3608 [Gemmatimonadetes bacterium]|nr:hypothetical protein [Gemmatimonadota bacterium]
MVFYEVTLDVEPGLAAELEAYMRGRHIPQIFATGCFRTIRLDRAGEARFRTRYGAHTQADLDRYVAEHAPALREDFAAHFPAGLALSREVWSEAERWG